MSEFVDLTVITVRLKKHITDSISDSFLGISGKSNSKDDYGRDAEFYKELGIDPPEDLEENNIINEDGSFNVSDSDLETIESPGRFRVETIMFFVADEKKGSTVYLDIDYKISVKESVEEIEEKINKLSKKSKNVVK